MVDFGKTMLLAENRVDGWEEYYIDYARLKSLIKKAAKAKKRKEEQNIHWNSRLNPNLNTLTKRKGSKQSINRMMHDSTGELTDLNLNPPSAIITTQSISKVVSDEYVTVLKFKQVLDHDIQKLVLWVLTREGQLAERLYNLSKDGQLLKMKISTLVQDYRQRQQQQQQQQNQQQPNSSSNTNHNARFSMAQAGDDKKDELNAWNHLKESTQLHREFGQDLLQFVNFIAMNVTGLRKILKKHDKNFPHHQLRGAYLQTNRNRNNNNNSNTITNGGSIDLDTDGNSYDQIDSHLDKLYHFGGLSALVLTLRRQFDGLHLLELNLLTISDAAKSATQHRAHRRNRTELPSSYGTPGVTATAVTPSTYGSVDLGGVAEAAGAIVSPMTKQKQQIASMKETPTVTNRKQMMVPVPMMPPRIPSFKSSLLPPPGATGLTTTTTTTQNLVVPSKHPHRRVNSALPPSGNDAVNADGTDFHPASLGVTSPVSPPSGLGLEPGAGNFHNHHAHTNIHRPTHLLKATVTKAHEPILDQINEARSKLHETTKFTELVAAQALIFVDDDDDKNKIPDSEKTPASEFTTVQKISSMLNLWSTFLYMTNYYIVAPTVGDYALRLGSDESMSGIIIGMTPNAALIATVLYGFWSNYSYKNALIFAACSCVVGNILYALALYYDSITMVLCGRFLIGFGSARSINRRYIADVFSKADRTAASADFVTYAAFGMAAGPGAAFGLGNVAFDQDNLLWSNVNAPGWIMLIAWIIFLIAFVLFFQEPDRSHLMNDDSPTEEEEEEEEENTPEKMELTVTKTNNGGGSEMEPLLVHLEGGDYDGNNNVWTAGDLKNKTKEDEPLYKNIPVMLTLWMYFVLKLVLEMLLSSTGTLTKHYFSWNSSRSGLFMAFVAMLMFPVNFGVSRLAQQYEDRELIAGTMIMMLVSVLGFLDYFPHYSIYQYAICSIGIFVSTNSLEGVNMSLLSKTIPKAWAKGTFNSGFLATEAGTLARSVGDVLISAVAGGLGMNMLLNGLFIPMAILCAFTLLIVYFFYDQLVVTDDDDDDDDTGSVVSNDSIRSLKSKSSM